MTVELDVRHERMFASAADGAMLSQCGITSDAGGRAVGRVARMAEQEKRQSWRRTRRELRVSMSRHGRKWLRGVWNATASTASQFADLSPLTTLLGGRLAEDVATREHAEGEEIQHALRIAVVYGYAARMVLVDPTDQPSLKPAAFHLSAQSDPEQLASNEATSKRLLDRVRSIALDKFDSVMTLPPEVWSGLVAKVTQKLQHQFGSDKDKKLSWRELSRQRVEKMLKYGYVLRCLDETLDAGPAYRERGSGAETGADAEAATPATRTSGR